MGIVICWRALWSDVTVLSTMEIRVSLNRIVNSLGFVSLEKLIEWGPLSRGLETKLGTGRVVCTGWRGAYRALAHGCQHISRVSEYPSTEAATTQCLR